MHRKVWDAITYTFLNFNVATCLRIFNVQWTSSGNVRLCKVNVYIYFSIAVGKREQPGRCTWYLYNTGTFLFTGHLWISNRSRIFKYISVFMRCRSKYMAEVWTNQVQCCSLAWRTLYFNGLSVFDFSTRFALGKCGRYNRPRYYGHVDLFYLYCIPGLTSPQN